MNPVTPTTVLTAAYGTVAEPGTVTGTGIDFSPSYEQDFSYFASCGAVSAGGNRYYRSLITVVGGTVTGGISAGIIAKPRTL